MLFIHLVGILTIISVYTILACRVLFPTKPNLSPPTNLSFFFRRIDMKQFKVTLSWVPSVDVTVVNQTLAVSVDDKANDPAVLDKTVSTYSLNVNEKVVLKVSLVASNGVHTSPAVSATFNVPAFVDVVVPVSPTGLAVNYEVVDVPDAPAVA